MTQCQHWTGSGGSWYHFIQEDFRNTMKLMMKESIPCYNENIRLDLNVWPPSFDLIVFISCVDETCWNKAHFQEGKHFCHVKTLDGIRGKISSKILAAPASEVHNKWGKLYLRPTWYLHWESGVDETCTCERWSKSGCEAHSSSDHFWSECEG